MGPATETPAPAGLTKDQFRECLTLGVSIDQIQTLEARGFTFEDIVAMAPSLKPEAVLPTAPVPRGDRLPENFFHPDVSAFNPQGERDHPRLPLPAKAVWFGGWPVERELTTAAELALLHRLKPGVYTVTRTDENTEQVPVEFQHDGTGALVKIFIGAKTGKEHRNVFPSLIKVLTEIVSQIPASAAA